MHPEPAIEAAKPEWLPSTWTSEFDERVLAATGRVLHGLDIRTIQVSIGLRCNLECCHCHVICSPRRSESMDWPTMERVIAAARRIGRPLIDLTGGAPEMNPDFRRLVETLAHERFPVLVRTNLVILLEPGYETFPAFYRAHRVRLVGSLPSCRPDDVAAQRGDRVYEACIAAIRRLNAFGYGIDPELPLHLGTNPIDPEPPRDQDALESEFRRELLRRHGVRFMSLFAIANAPLGRFRTELKGSGRLDRYLDLLRGAFNPATLDHLMCRHQLNVRWDGALFDCDFNQALKRRIGFGAPGHISRFDADRLAVRRILTGLHCFTCAAGRGSSCGGALLVRGRSPYRAQE
jgi:radical SAM/Cys-rich protein